jgi:hypothetical protein
MPDPKEEREGSPVQGCKELPKRKDGGKLHATQTSVLSRGLLEALRHHGQNIRRLREMERALRATLRPTGPLAELFFDRFWHSILRLILASLLEAKRLTQKSSEFSNKPGIPELHSEFEPVLVISEKQNDLPIQTSAPLFEAELVHRLSLIARYDRAASREMYRSLSLLLVLRDQGDDSALLNWADAMVGIKLNSKEGLHDS